MASKTKGSKTDKTTASKSDKIAAAKPAKSKPATSKPAKSAARATVARAKPAKAAEAFYLSFERPGVLIRAGKPAAGKATAIASFAEAKEKALDHLLDLIEHCERQLLAVRRSADHEHYERLRVE